MGNMLHKLLGRKPEAAFITVVSGLPRSGTSMMMKMLDAGGIPPITDGLRTADVDNPKGYYEFERVKKLDKGDTAWLPDALGKSVKIISALLVHLPPSYSYRVLFMRRDLDEVLASQAKMLARRQEKQAVDDDKMKELFTRHVRQVEMWMQKQANLTYLDVDYGALVRDPWSQLPQIKAFLGGQLDVERMAAVADPDLYRNRAD